MKIKETNPQVSAGDLALGLKGLTYPTERGSCHETRATTREVRDFGHFWAKTKQRSSLRVLLRGSPWQDLCSIG